MKHRILGKSGIQVSALGLGCMGMSTGLYSQPNEAQAIKTLHSAYEFGINFFDTADMYGNGHNEEFIGKVLKPFRDKIIIATKCGIVCEANGISRNGSKKYIKQACEKSLKRLGMPVIDIYYLHRLDPHTLIEESMEAMSELHHEGKIRSVGLSEVDADIIKRANAIFPVTAVQSEYSIIFRKAAESVLPLCKKLDIAFVPFSPISRGFLSGTIRSMQQLEPGDFRRGLPYIQDKHITHNLELVSRITKIAKQQQRTPAQVSLAWLLAQDPQIIPIPGTTKVEHLQENVAAVDIELSASELNELNDACRQISVQGKRFPQELEGWFVNISN